MNEKLIEKIMKEYHKCSYYEDYDSYEEALKFLKADAIQKTYPTAYIIGRVKK